MQASQLNEDHDELTRMAAGSFVARPIRAGRRYRVLSAEFSAHTLWVETSPRLPLGKGGGAVGRGAECAQGDQDPTLTGSCVWNIWKLSAGGGGPVPMPSAQQLDAELDAQRRAAAAEAARQQERCRHSGRRRRRRRLGDARRRPELARLREDGGWGGAAAWQRGARQRRARVQHAAQHAPRPAPVAPHGAADASATAPCWMAGPRSARRRTTPSRRPTGRTASGATRPRSRPTRARRRPDGAAQEEPRRAPAEGGLPRRGAGVRGPLRAPDGGGQQTKHMLQSCFSDKELRVAVA